MPIFSARARVSSRVLLPLSNGLIPRIGRSVAGDSGTVRAKALDD